MRANRAEHRIDRRVAIAYLAVVAVPVYLLIDLAVTRAHGWQASSSFYLVVVVPAALAIAAPTALVLTRGGRSWLRLRAAAIATSAATAIAAVLIVELVLGMTLAPRPSFHLSVPNSTRSFKPRADLMPGIAGDSTYTANSRGIRGPEFPAERSAAYRILCVGGSSTACLYLDDSEAWSHLLMERLNEGDGTRRYWIGDVGVSGYGTWDHVRLLDDDDLLGAVDCLLFLIGINDFTRTVQGRPVAAPAGVKPVWTRSNLYMVFEGAYQVHRQKRRHMDETPDGSKYPERRARYASARPVDELPDLTRGLAEYRTNVRSLIARCRALGIRPVFATQPVLWIPDLPDNSRELLWIGYQNDSGLTVRVLAEGMKVFNQALIDECAEAGEACIDLSVMNGRAEYFYDDCHYTEAGSAKVAELLAEWIRENP